MGETMDFCGRYQHQTLDRSKLKAFADEKINVVEKLNFVSGRGRKHCGKGAKTTFFTCFCRGERRKYAGKKVRLIRVSNSQPPGHESDILITEPLGRVKDLRDFSVNARHN